MLPHRGFQTVARGCRLSGAFNEAKKEVERRLIFGFLLFVSPYFTLRHHTLEVLMLLQDLVRQGSRGTLPATVVLVIHVIARASVMKGG